MLDVIKSLRLMVRILKRNPYRDPRTGRFTSGPGSKSPSIRAGAPISSKGLAGKTDRQVYDIYTKSTQSLNTAIRARAKAAESYDEKKIDLADRQVNYHRANSTSALAELRARGADPTRGWTPDNPVGKPVTIPKIDPPTPKPTPKPTPSKIKVSPAIRAKSDDALRVQYERSSKMLDQLDRKERNGEVLTDYQQRQRVFHTKQAQTHGAELQNRGLLNPSGNTRVAPTKKPIRDDYTNPGTTTPTVTRPARDGKAAVAKVEEHIRQSAKVQADLKLAKVAAENEYFRTASGRDKDAAARRMDEAAKAYRDHNKNAAEEIYKIIEGDRPPLDIKPRFNDNGKFTNQEKAKIEKSLKFVGRMVGENGTDYATVIDVHHTNKNRAWYVSNSIHINGSTPPKTIIHEAGHWYEDNTRSVQKSRRDMHNKRTAGDKLEPLKNHNSAYDYHEHTRADKYADPYMGKDYGHHAASEIVSMAIQFLYEDPIAFSKKDPESFRWAIETLHQGPGR